MKYTVGLTLLASAASALNGLDTPEQLCIQGCTGLELALDTETLSLQSQAGGPSITIPMTRLLCCSAPIKVDISSFPTLSTDAVSKSTPPLSPIPMEVRSIDRVQLSITTPTNATSTTTTDPNTPPSQSPGIPRCSQPNCASFCPSGHCSVDCCGHFRILARIGEMSLEHVKELGKNLTQAGLVDGLEEYVGLPATNLVETTQHVLGVGKSEL